MTSATLASNQLPVIDAHHHFWNLDQNYHPWLCDSPMIAFRYGDYTELKRNYLPVDFNNDVGAINLIGSVYVEAEWDPRDPIGETRWITQINRQSGFPTAVVAQAWLDRADAADVLRTQSEFPLVRSVRHKPDGAENLAAFEAGQRSLMPSLAWREGFDELAKLGLHFDLQTPFWHLPEARQLAEDFPETTIILNHTGLPADRSNEGLSRWRDAMSLLATAPNVRVKISGLGVCGQTWTTSSIAAIVRQTIELFGADRCMFASNFPVDSLCSSYASIYQTFYESVVEYDERDKVALFAGTAAKTYGIDASL